MEDGEEEEGLVRIVGGLGVVDGGGEVGCPGEEEDAVGVDEVEVGEVEGRVEVFDGQDA